jgi:drug/metabolite transporter (DMT)-like permease
VLPVALALGASIAWGCSDFLAGLKTRRLAVLWVLLVSQGTGLVLVLFAALGFGTFFVGMDLAADEGALWAVALNRAAAVAILVAIAFALRPGWLERRALAPLAAVGALDIAANTMFAIALTLGMAAIVSVLGSLYPLATVVLARAVLHEQVGDSQRAGVLAAVAGIGLVSLA